MEHFKAEAQTSKMQLSLPLDTDSDSDSTTSVLSNLAQVAALVPSQMLPTADDIEGLDEIGTGFQEACSNYGSFGC